MRNIRVIIILVWLIAVCSCGDGSGLDARFQEIDRLCDSSPEAAIDSLASVNPTNLSDKDLNRYRLLWIKSRDKAYIAHKSDTLILEVIDYYEKHRSEGLYPEALYYGGRVYSDLGDLPTALEFFQKSLDEIPEDDDHLLFKSTVLNQSGRLLHRLRLDPEAIDYLEKSLQINPRKDIDYYNVAFTHSLIASSLRRQNKIIEARKHIDEALRITPLLDEFDRYTIQSEFAEMLYKEGKVDSALLQIRSLPSIVDSLTKPYCLAIASTLYKDAEILDTAYLYARMLTRLKAPNNKKTGYKVIFSEELRDYVPKDTLLKLMPEYKQVVEDYLNTNEAEQALIQNSRFNYSTHVKEREKAESELHAYKNAFMISVSIVTIIILFIIIYILYRRYIKVKRESNLMEILSISESLKNENNRSLQNIDEDTGYVESKTYAISDFSDIKKSLLDKMSAIKSNKSYSLVEEQIVNSGLYAELKEKIKNKKCIADSENTWHRIEDIIETVSPGFSKRLDILTEGKITPSERRVALLMKCGITPTNISILLARGRNTISSQRRSLADKISDEKMDLDSLDKLIVTL